MNFRSVERTVPEVLAIVGQTLPIRSAIFLREASPSSRRAIAWQAEGGSAEGLQEALNQAQSAYARLVGSAGEVRLERGAALPAVPAASPGASSRFLVLPFVAGDGVVAGALQLETAGGLGEHDLALMSAVVQQVASALERNARDEALRVSEAKFAGIVSVAADAILSVDASHRIVLYNGAAAKIFGWSAEEALGQPLDILLPAGVHEIHRHHIEEFASAAENATWMGERRSPLFGLRKSGETFPVEASISKLKVGENWLFTAVLRDITEHLRIEREERYLADVGSVLATSLDSQETLANVSELTLRELADVCVIDFIDENGDLRRLEARTSDPTKRSVVEAIKHFPVDRNRPHLTATVLQTRRAQRLEEVTGETFDALAQGAEHRRLLEEMAPTSIMGVPLTVHGRLVGALVVASCRPERRFGAADLHLLEEVGRRAALALENARLHVATRRAVQARDEVLGVVAHDLRNPLNTILMQAGVLQQRGVEVPVLERAVARMNRLIQDLLDVNRMEAGHLTVERGTVPARQLVLESAEAQKSLAASHSLEMRVDIAPDLPDVSADRDRLLQVFENLIGNAAKFTPPGGRITLAARPGTGMVLFSVADTGAGISAEQLPHLFDRFWQAGQADRRGVGLGLAIVKGIVEAHGGRIRVESTPGQGTTFHFSVPTAPVAEARAMEPRVATGSVPEHDRV